MEVFNMAKIYDPAIEAKIETIIKKFSSEIEEAEKNYTHKKNMLLHNAHAKQFELSELHEITRILTDINELSKGLYTTYEVCAITLNDQCLEYENAGMSHKNMQEIVDFLDRLCKGYEQLKDEVRVTFDYTSKYDLGNMGYSPSVAVLGIKKSWELKLSLHKECDEERIARENKEKERKKFLEARAERAKQAEEKRKKEEAARKEQELRELEVKEEQWKKGAEAIQKDKTKEMDMCIDKIKNQYIILRDALKVEHTRNINEITDSIEHSNEKIKELEKQLENTGIFKFSLKRRLKEDIQETINKIQVYEQQKKQAEIEYQRKMSDLYSDEDKSLLNEKIE